MLPPLPIQYADYATWQREQISGERLAARSHSGATLAGLPPVLELPTGPAAARGADRAWHDLFLLGARAGGGRPAGTRAASATLFQVLLAAYQPLLYRYTGQSDSCVGTPIANRTRPELEGLIGFFVNTLVMRSSERTPDVK